MTDMNSKPDPSAFIAMRQVREGDTNRCNEYLPSANPYGTSPRKKKELVKKWKPTSTTENSRPDEWMGGGKPQVRSWKVKSVSTTNKPPPSSDSDSDSGSDDDDDRVEKDKAPNLVGASKPSEWKPKPIAAQKVEPAPAAAAEPEPQAVSDDDEYTEEEVESDTEVEVPSDTEIEIQSDTEVEVEVESEDENETAVVAAVVLKPEVSPKKPALLPTKKTTLPKVSPKISPKVSPKVLPKKKSEAFQQIERPDATAFRNAMRMEQDAGASHIDEYLPSAHDSSSNKKRGEPVRKWKPTASTSNSRPDDWLGAAPSPRSWKVKSLTPSSGGDKVIGSPVTTPPSTPAAATTSKWSNPKWKPPSPDRSSSSASLKSLGSLSSTSSSNAAPKWKPKVDSVAAPSAPAAAAASNFSKWSNPKWMPHSTPGRSSSTSSLKKIRQESDDKWKPHSTPGRSSSSSSLKKIRQESDDNNSSLGSLSAGSLSAGDLEIQSEHDGTKKDTKKKETATNRMWKSTSGLEYSNNKKVGVVHKPDPSAFIAMRQVREGDTNRCDEYLPSANPYGTSPRKKMEPVKKWKPSATTENSRPDEWMGGGKPKARSWKVKSVSTTNKPPSSDSDSDDDDDDDEKDNAPNLGASTPSEWKPNKPVAQEKVVLAPPAAKPEPQAVSNEDDTEVEVQSDTEIEVQSDTEIEVESEDENETALLKPVSPKKTALLPKKRLESPTKKTTSPKKKSETFQQIQRPDATAFRNAMRMEQDAGASHIDEYLPSAHDSSSNRKRGEPVKKWKPTASTENSRPDEWMGSGGKKPVRSWTVKSVSTKPPSTGGSDSD
jgi:hypothetical protein